MTNETEESEISEGKKEANSYISKDLAKLDMGPEFITEAPEE